MFRDYSLALPVAVPREASEHHAHRAQRLGRQMAEPSRKIEPQGSGTICFSTDMVVRHRRSVCNWPWYLRMRVLPRAATLVRRALRIRNLPRLLPACRFPPMNIQIDEC